MFQVGLTARAK